MKKSTSKPKKQARAVTVRTRAPRAVAKAGTNPQLLWTGTAGSWQSSLFGPHEPFTGAWQRNIGLDGITSPLSFSAVYACITGISSDIGKMPMTLMREKPSGVWENVENSPFSPVLDRPNHYQNRIQFLESWMLSKLLSGNTYVGLERDNRGIVNKMYVLEPTRVQPLVAVNGDVYYQLGEETLNTINEPIVVPASEIIHDRMECLYHKLVGISPLFACAATAGLGSSIQSSSQQFFENSAQPGGMLSAPGRISNDTAERMKALFEQRFSGPNRGKLFVAGDGLEFKPIALAADVSQLVEQLGWSVEDVARAFHYPVYKLDNSKLPPYSGNNIQTLQMQYLSDCLQKHIEAIEKLLDDSLGLPSKMHVVLDTDVLLRMDTQTLYKTISDGIRGQWLSTNEGRVKVNLDPVEGGEFPRAQVQYVSLPLLKKQEANMVNITPQQQAVPREFVADLLSAAIGKELETPSA